MTVFALRIACPDRPGSLGAVATALGRAQVNIISLDVLERDEGIVVDHLLVEADALGYRGLVDVVQSVPEVVAELVHTVSQTPRRVGTLELAANLLRASGDRLETLTLGLVETFNASWCIALRARQPQPELLTASPGAPTLVGAGTPWLPLASCRRLRPGPWVPSRWSLDPLTASFAVAPLDADGDALLLARARGPAFRPGELADLGHLVRIAEQAALLRPEEIALPG